MTEFKKLTDEELDKVTGGYNWIGFSSCLLSHGANSIPALAEIIQAIKAKNWSKVATLAKQPAIASLPIVAECLASF